MTQRLGANVLGSLTVNTDFAETEVDTRRTNLTRFPLFFPEKRTFFLQGADIFNFGLGLDEDVVPFFSRRIGLVDDSAVPIGVGGKVTGRVGRTNIGVARGPDARGRRDLAPGTSLGVMRIKQNVFDESSVGMIATFGDPLGRRGSWLAGADVNLQTSRFRGDKNFAVGLWGLAAGRADLGGDATAAGFSIDYPNDLWEIDSDGDGASATPFSRRSASCPGRASTATRSAPTSSRARSGVACGRCSTSSAIRW